MKKLLKSILLLAVMAALVGCAYLGAHGPSIQSYPGVHHGITEDTSCLQCHHPDHGTAPPTPHPSFKGCLKCHNDKVVID